MIKIKTILITGGSRGIGKQIALDCKDLGLNVCITYNTTNINTKEFEGIKAYKLDVRDNTQISFVVDDIILNYGKIDYLVNNAGICQTKLFDLITDSDLDNMININLKSVFNITKEVVKKSMLKNKFGSIVNISSIWGNVGASCETHYSMCKGGINTFSKALANEIGLSNITVNAVSPGVIQTDMINEYTKEELDELISNIPMNRLGTVKDISDIVTFLISDKARYITGQVITVDGGFTI
ncbi:MAG: SDR family oxidoreductase [Clostridia bacterium]